MAALVPGLYGKLPGRGDFIRHGWDEAMVEALDHWLAVGLASWRHDNDAVFATRFAAVPLYVCYLPPGWIGGAAVHGVVSPSVDRAGRFFFLVAGVAGPAAEAWHLAVARSDFADALVDATYAALGPDSDPDTLLATIAAAIPTDVEALAWRAGLATPADAVFWALGEGDPHVIHGASANPALLADLLNVIEFSGDDE